MNATVTSTEAPVLEYAKHLRALHELDLQGKHNSEEADAIRDQMDAPWYAMTPQERERIGGLSEDLYALAEGGPPSIAMAEQQIQAWKKGLEECKYRYLQGDIDGWLAFWRKPRPSHYPLPEGVPAFVVHFFQAQSWAKLGDFETAAIFMKAAENGDSQVSRLLMDRLLQVA